jgi:HSP20 family molecular chaperone IbpA
MTLREFFREDPFFKTSWDDVNKLRQEITKELWQKFEQEMKGKEGNVVSSSTHASSSSSRSTQQLSTSEQTLESSSTSGDAPTPPSTPTQPMNRHPSLVFCLLPRLISENLSKEVKLFPNGDDEAAVHLKDDEQKFEVSLNVHRYRPDELKVHVENNRLTVDAKHEEKSDDGNAFISHQFSRKYTLPAGCEADRVSSKLSSDGILVITAPKKVALQNEGQIHIAIEKK